MVELIIINDNLRYGKVELNFPSFGWNFLLVIILVLIFFRLKIIEVILLIIGIFILFLVLLVPTPLVDLRFRESSFSSYSLISIFRPGWVLQELLHEISHSLWAFAVSLVPLYLLLLHEVCRWHSHSTAWERSWEHLTERTTGTHLLMHSHHWVWETG